MTEEELKEVEYLAGQLFPDEQLAVILEVPLHLFREELVAGKSDLAKAVLAGRLTRETAIRESILDMACRGSSPAQLAAMDMLKRLHT